MKVRDPLFTQNSEGCHVILVVTGILEFSHSKYLSLGPYIRLGFENGGWACGTKSAPGNCGNLDKSSLEKVLEGRYTSQLAPTLQYLILKHMRLCHRSA